MPSTDVLKPSPEDLIRQTDLWLAEHPLHPATEQLIDQYFAFGEIDCPFIHGTIMFQWRREGRENHKALHVTYTRTGEHRRLLDPNADETGKTIIPDHWATPSHDGGKLAYQISNEGDAEYGRAEIMDVTTGDVIDTIPGTHRLQLVWGSNNESFYYTRLEDPEDRKSKRSLYFHQIGTDWRQDKLVFTTENTGQWLVPEISEDGNSLFVNVHSTGINSIYYYKTHSEPPTPEQFSVLFKDKPGQESHLYVAPHTDGYIYARTDIGAPLNRALRIANDHPNPSDLTAWEEVIPERPDAVLTRLIPVGTKLIASWLHQASSQIEIIDIATRKRIPVTLPKIGTVSSIEVDNKSGRAMVQFESFDTPATIYELNTETGAFTLIEKLTDETGLPPLETRYVTYKSAGGTEVSMFLVGPQGFEPDGQHHVLMNGYGGFGNSIPTMPRFSSSMSFPALYPWLAQGNVVAIPHCRGGGEYGEPWHKAGMREGRRKTYADFAAAADWLVSQGYTTPEKTIAWGKSQGGLLVTATAMLYPGRFKAVVAESALLNMVEFDDYMKFKDYGYAWIDEYGNPEKKGDRRFLRALSPVHLVKQGADYPAFFIYTADGDNLVSPLHGAEFAQRLAPTTSSGQPVLLYRHKEVGHGMASPTAKLAEKTKTIYAFIEAQMAA